MPGAEIIHGKADAQCFESIHFLDGVLHVVQHQAFRQLEFQTRRVGTGLLQLARDLIDKVVLLKLAGTHIDGQLQACRGGAVFPGLELQAGFMQHPLANGDNQSGFFGQSDEFKG